MERLPQWSAIADEKTVILLKTQVHNETIEPEMADIEEKFEQVERRLALTPTDQLLLWIQANKYQIVFSILSTIGFIVFTMETNSRLRAIENSIIELKQQTGQPANNQNK